MPGKAVLPRCGAFAGWLAVGYGGGPVTQPRATLAAGRPIANLRLALPHWPLCGLAADVLLHLREAKVRLDQKVD